MPLVVGGVKFERSVWIKDQDIILSIIEKLKKLPDLDVLSLDDANVEEDKALLCLQTEAVYIDTYNPANNKIFIGTKDLHDCIAIYARTKTDHLLIHVDGINPNEIKDYLQLFHDKENIKIKLVGGKTQDTSRTILIKIIRNLFNASNELNINIEIEAQKIMERNKPTAEVIYENLYNLIFEKGDILSRQFFNIPLDISYFKNRKASDFISRSIDIKNSENFLATFEAFHYAEEIYGVEKTKKYKNIFDNFKTKITSEKNLLSFIDNLFSKEALTLFEDYNYRYFHVRLCNFVFDITTGKLSIIPAHLKTPHQIERDAVQQDIYKKPDYFLYTNGHTFFKPRFSNTFLKKVEELKNPLINNAIEPEDFLNKIESTDLTRLNIKAKIFKNFDPNYTEKQCSVFKSDKTFNEFYRNEKIPSDIMTKKLEFLNDLTNLQFFAMLRCYPEDAVDALLLCETKSEAISIKEKIISKNILAHAIQFDNKYYACVTLNTMNHKIFDQKLESCESSSRSLAPYITK